MHQKQHPFNCCSIARHYTTGDAQPKNMYRGVGTRKQVLPAKLNVGTLNFNFNFNFNNTLSC